MAVKSEGQGVKGHLGAVVANVIVVQMQRKRVQRGGLTEGGQGLQMRGAAVGWGWGKQCESPGRPHCVQTFYVLPERYITHGGDTDNTTLMTLTILTPPASLSHGCFAHGTMGHATNHT